MKLSFSSLGCAEKSLSEMITLAVEMGYEGIELRGANGTMNLWEAEEFSENHLSHLRRQCKDSGICITDIGAGINFSAGTKEHTRKALAEAQRFAEIAAALDSPYLRIFGGKIPDGMAREECEKWIAEGCAMLGDILRLYDVMPLLETHDDFSTGASVRRILDLAGQENLGVVWDILHPYHCGEQPQETWQYLQDSVKHLHIKDAAPSGELVLPGEGTVPIPEIVEILKAHDYDGYLSLEWEKWWHPEIADGEVAFRVYLEYMRRLQG